MPNKQNALLNFFQKQQQTSDRRRSVWMIAFLSLFIAVIVNLANIYVNYQDVYAFMNRFTSSAGLECPSFWSIVIAYEYPFLPSNFVNKYTPSFIVKVIRGMKDKGQFRMTQICGSTHCGSTHCPPKKSNWSNGSNVFSQVGVTTDSPIVSDYYSNNGTRDLENLFQGGIYSFAENSGLPEDKLMDRLFDQPHVPSKPPCTTNALGYGTAIASGAINMGLMGGMAGGPAGAAVGGLVGGVISALSSRHKICK